LSADEISLKLSWNPVIRQDRGGTGRQIGVRFVVGCRQTEDRPI
jgi:hypothetical protein